MGRRKNNPSLVEELIEGRWTMNQDEFCANLRKKDWLFSGIWFYTINGESYQKWTAKSVSNSNGVTTQMAMWKRIAIFYGEIYADRFWIIQGGYEIYL